MVLSLQTLDTMDKAYSIYVYFAHVYKKYMKIYVVMYPSMLSTLYSGYMCVLVQLCGIDRISYAIYRQKEAQKIK